MKFDEITQSKQTDKPVEIPSAEIKPSLGKRLLREKQKTRRKKH